MPPEVTTPPLEPPCNPAAEHAHEDAKDLANRINAEIAKADAPNAWADVQEIGDGEYGVVVEETRDWWDHRDNLALLCRFLVDKHKLDLDGVLYVLGKPWKYADEFKEASR